MSITVTFADPKIILFIVAVCVWLYEQHKNKKIRFVKGKLKGLPFAISIPYKRSLKNGIKWRRKEKKT